MEEGKERDSLTLKGFEKDVEVDGKNTRWGSETERPLRRTEAAESC